MRLDELAQEAHRLLVRSQLVPLEDGDAHHRPALAPQQPLCQAHLAEVRARARARARVGVGV